MHKENIKAGDEGVVQPVIKTLFRLTCNLPKTRFPPAFSCAWVTGTIRVQYGRVAGGQSAKRAERLAEKAQVFTPQLLTNLWIKNNRKRVIIA